MNVLPMANFQAPEVPWLSLAPILIVLGGAGAIAFVAFRRRRPTAAGGNGAAALAGDDAAYVNGAVIPVDGGLGMGH